MIYFRTLRHYHRPDGLDDRVRNGNEYFTVCMVTGKHLRASQPEGRLPQMCFEDIYK